MRTLYIILSVVGWAWLAVAAVVLPIKLRRLKAAAAAEECGLMTSEAHEP